MANVTVQKLVNKSDDTTPSFISEADRVLTEGVMQPIWDWVRLGHEDYIRSPLFPIVMSVSFFFICMVPFSIVDLYGHNWYWVQKWKIQSDVKVTWPQMRKAIFVVLWNHVIYILPAAIAQWIWTPLSPLPEKAPGFMEFTLQMAALVVLFDFQYWVWHVTHHKVRWLYKHVHSVHHQYHSPFSWVTQYAHPWELFNVGIYTTVDPWLLNSHLLTTWSFMLLNIVISVEAHIGFDFPWLLHNWDPSGLWAGSVKHDMHHMRPMSNFEPFFNIWDRLFGTYIPGMQAGGKKSKALIAWENEHKQKIK